MKMKYSKKIIRTYTKQGNKKKTTTLKPETLLGKPVILVLLTQCFLLEALRKGKGRGNSKENTNNQTKAHLQFPNSPLTQLN